MLLKPFETPASHYVYSAWSNQIARVPRHVHQFFAEGTGQEGDQRETHEKAVALGLLPEREVTLSVFPPSTILDGIQEVMKTGPNVLVLTITEQCNFRCTYCTYSGGYEHSRSHSSKSMSEETARKAVDWYGSFNRDEFHIGFYGGEPLLHFDLMARTVEYARNSLEPKGKLSFGLTTNGSLLTDRVVDFLADHHFETHVSLDGPAEIHDRYRIDARGKTTFDTVWKNICGIQSRHPAYFAESVGFTMTVVPKDPLAATRSFIQGNPTIFEGKIPKVSPLSEEDPGIYHHLGVADHQRAIDYTPAAQSFLEASLSGRMPDGFSRGCLEAAMRRIHYREMHAVDRFETHGGQCVPGIRCHVDPEGVLHMCEHMAHHFPIGTLAEGFDSLRIEEYLTDYGRLVERTCGRCWAMRLCRKCFANLARGTALSEERMHEFCARKLDKIERSLIQYCSAREQNDHCFDWLPEKGS
ncbi:MAG: radical SAM protein [Syntrophobacteraceae bacterium]|jgi:uncharacterized protein|nr:radical SAM protein [Syntrophobacteraceae bacterium]